MGSREYVPFHEIKDNEYYLKTCVQCSLFHDMDADGLGMCGRWEDRSVSYDHTACYAIRGDVPTESDDDRMNNIAAFNSNPRNVRLGRRIDV